MGVLIQSMYQFYTFFKILEYFFQDDPIILSPLQPEHIHTNYYNPSFPYKIYVLESLTSSENVIVAHIC